MRESKLEIQWITRSAIHGVPYDNQYGRSDLTLVASNFQSVPAVSQTAHVTSDDGSLVFLPWIINPQPISNSKLGFFFNMLRFNTLTPHISSGYYRRLQPVPLVEIPAHSVKKHRSEGKQFNFAKSTANCHLILILYNQRLYRRNSYTPIISNNRQRRYWSIITQ